MSDRVLLFLHIPKTGGATLNRILDRWYSPKRIVDVAGKPPECLAKVPRNRIEHAQVIRGHFSYGVHEHLAGRFCYFTMLRDPIEKAVSLYRFAKTRPQHYLYDFLNREHVGLTELLTLDAGWSLRNDLVRRLSGESIPSGIEPATELGPAHLEIARSNLLSDGTVFGLMSHYDESLLLMSADLGLGRPYYRRRNVGPSRSGRSPLSASDLESLRAANRLDIQLYRSAVEVFEERLEQASWLPEAVSALRRANRCYSRWVYPLEEVWIRGRRAIA